MRRNARALALAMLMVMLVARPARAQPPQIGVLVAAGWNNIGYVGLTRPVPVALAQLAGKYESVWTWDTLAQRWLGYNPLAPSAGDFADLRQNQAYWIRMTAPGELTMAVPPASPGVVIAPGWNNFVYPGSERPVADALAAAAGRFQVVWRWDAARQSWNGFTPVAPAASDFNTLAPYRTYFLNLSPGAQLTLAPPATPTPVVGATPSPSATGVTSATPVASRTPTPTPKPLSCFPFQSYQPQIGEVSRAENRAGYNQLLPDPDFKIPPLETQVDGSGLPVAPSVPPTLLKAIGWIESGWRQASFSTPRGATGPTVTSTSCAYGVMQLLTGMDIDDSPTPKQQKIGTDYISNIAAGAQLLGIKWNLAPERLPLVLPRNPRALEDWYYAVWAYHCYGDVCQALGIHNNPEDPALKWPRPAYNSPDQLASGGQFTFSDYPYQELVYGVVANPPRVNGAPVWPALPVSLPARGTVGFPEPKVFLQPGNTIDPTQPDAP